MQHSSCRLVLILVLAVTVVVLRVSGVPKCTWRVSVLVLTLVSVCVSGGVSVCEFLQFSYGERAVACICQEPASFRLLVVVYVLVVVVVVVVRCSTYDMISYLIVVAN